MYGLEVKGLAANLLRARSVPAQVRFAAAKAINGTTFAQRADMVAAMPAAFDRPTPWIQKSIWVGKRATADSLEGWVYPRDLGGKSVDPSNVLRAEVFGGARKAKRSELAFRRVGILLPGYWMVPSMALLASDKVDAYGNVKGSFIVQLLAYFQAFGEQGYRANMKPAGIKRLARRNNPRVGPPRRFAHVGGVEYFVSRGKGEFTGRGSWASGQQQHFPAGIWQRSGTHGSDVKPVFLFVKQPHYQVRLRLPEIFRSTGLREFPRRYAAAIAESTAWRTGTVTT